MKTLPNPKKNRGSILVTLLFVATIAVIGMMALIYNELTKTPQLTEEAYERQQQVEILTPNAKNTDERVFRNNENKITAPVTTTDSQATAPDIKPVPIQTATPAVTKANNINNETKSVTENKVATESKATTENKTTEVEKPVSKIEKVAEPKKIDPPAEIKPPVANKPAPEKTNKNNEIKNSKNAIDELL